jgi:hypothetical protein
MHTIMLINYLTNFIARSYASKLNVQVMTIPKQKIVRIFFKKKEIHKERAKTNVARGCLERPRAAPSACAPTWGIFFIFFFLVSFF